MYLDDGIRSKAANAQRGEPHVHPCPPSFNLAPKKIQFHHRPKNWTHLGVEAVAKLGDAAGDLVEVDRLLPAVPLDDVHLAHGWTVGGLGGG